MSDEVFDNFFKGKKSYPYNIPRKQKFLMLVEKEEIIILYSIGDMMINITLIWKNYG